MSGPKAGRWVVIDGIQCTRIENHALAER